MKTKRLFPCLLAVLVWSSYTFAQPTADDAPGRVPKGKWFTSDRGYQEALELQKSTGADIFIYFFRYDIADEKGLCKWWETHAMQQGRVSKLLQDYIKVKVQMPFKPREREMFAEKFKFNKTPAAYVVKAEGGFPQRIQVFDWPGNKPKLKDHSTLVSEIVKASSQRYQDANKK